MATALRRLQLRIERSCERYGASYPWWIPTSSTVAIVAIAFAAWWQRGGPHAAPVMYAAVVLALLPLLLWLPRAWMSPAWLEASTTVLAVGLFLTEPVRLDLAPLLFAIVVGEVAAVAPVWLASTVAVVDVVAVVVAGVLGQLDTLGLYVIGVVLGTSVGIALRWQMRALRAERENTSFTQERAISAERQRLAREVHDVVGHSLSINLLHVTAARHALEHHADVADAVDALVEAERVGRAAMGDLRRTVAVLSAAPGDTQPLPGVGDIGPLVERSRTAGLDVTYTTSGHPGRVGAAAALGLFRIVQESLNNIARHAPSESASVSLVEDRDAVRLTVVNSLTGGEPEISVGGSGLSGMAARAEQLGAELRVGVEVDRWVVEVVVPAPLDRPTPVAVSR